MNQNSCKDNNYFTNKKYPIIFIYEINFIRNQLLPLLRCFLVWGSGRCMVTYLRLDDFRLQIELLDRRVTIDKH